MDVNCGTLLGNAALRTMAIVQEQRQTLAIPLVKPVQRAPMHRHIAGLKVL